MEITNIDDFFNYLLKYKYEIQRFGKYDIKVKKLNVNTSLVESVDLINYLYDTCKKINLIKINFNPSGSIKKCIFHSYGSYSCDIIKNSANNILKGIIITIIIRNHIFKFKFGHLQMSKESTMTGSKAYIIFRNICKKLNIDLDKYAINNGQDVKLEIEKPLIINYVKHKEENNVHHLDIHKAWPSNTCKEYPELLKAYKSINDKTIIDPLNGYFQSNKCNYKFSNLSKAGINGCNKQISELCDKLEKNGFAVLGLNTDGIWYKDRTYMKRLYHDENEGTEFGQWENDHINCTWYAKSNGQYYFIENDKFYVKARGYYQYEQYKPRKDWNKDDFFAAMNTLVTFDWNDDIGLIIKKGDYIDSDEI